MDRTVDVGMDSVLRGASSYGSARGMGHRVVGIGVLELKQVVDLVSLD